MNKQNKTGFTLVEMLIVIAIIALLAMVIVSSIRSLQEQGRAAQCKTNLKNLTQGVINKSTETVRWDHNKFGYTMFADSFVVWNNTYEIWQEPYMDYNDHPGDESKWISNGAWVSWLDSNGKRPLSGAEEAPKAKLPSCYAGKKDNDGRAAIMKGALWERINKDMRIYLCPKHKNVKKEGKANGESVCRSYVMNGYFFYSTTMPGDKEDGADNTKWVSWDPRKIYNVPEPSRVMLFAEIDLDGGKKDYTGALIPWGTTQVPKNDSPNNMQKFIDNHSGLETSPGKVKDIVHSIGFNHRIQGKKYGYVSFVDGHVTQLPEKYTHPDQPGKTINPTLRAAVGRY